MQGLKAFLENGKWKQMKKSDWVVLALVGVLLLIVALPGGKEKKTNALNAGSEEENTQTDAVYKDTSKQGSGDGDVYTAGLEEKLERVLSKMEGVGKVKVMITIADAGENVVEKDSSATATTTTETDSSGGSRTVTESGTDNTTVYVETGNETYPYIQKEKMPAIEGVVVVAEGGGNSKVVSDISEAVRALFPVEAHRIKVVKMAKTE